MDEHDAITASHETFGRAVREGNAAAAASVYARGLRLEPKGGAPIVDSGTYLLVHERQDDGSWRWAVEMFNPDAPPVTAGRAKEGRRR